MRSYFFVLLILFASSTHAEPVNWKWVDHVVQPGDTVRRVALRYFGFKKAESCIAKQIYFENRNLIYPGQKFHFLAPDPQISLPEFERLKPRCEFAKVFVDNQAVKSEAPAPEPPPLIESAQPPLPTPAPAFTSIEPEEKKPAVCNSAPVHHSSWNIGTGISYARIRQSWGGGFGGGARLESVEPFPIWAMARLQTKPGWWTEVQGESVTGALEVARLAEKQALSYRWTTYQLTTAVEPLSVAPRIFGAPFHPFLRAGLEYSRWPTVYRLSADDVILTNVAVPGVRVGLGFYTFFSPAWMLEMALNWSTPLGHGEFDSLNANYAVDGYLRLQYLCLGKRGFGVNWHGRAQEAKFQREGIPGQGQLSFSAFELFISHSF